MNIINLFHFAILNFKETFPVKTQLDKLRKSEFWSAGELESLQELKLKRLLKTAAANVLYWKYILSIIDNNDSPINSNFLQTLPILNKKIIRENGEAMFSRKVDKYITATTGGTTGHPLNVRRDYTCNAITKAATWRARESWGYQPSDRSVYLVSFGKGSFLGRFRMRLGNKKMGDAFPSSDKEVESINKMITAFQPKAIEGFASGLVESIVRSKAEKGMHIPVIVSTGEMLYKHQRQALENYYSGKVYTYYGSNEIGSIAYECEHQQLHICEEHVIVETIDDEGNPIINQPGKVLVTDLDNMAMPFIRYEIGDIATISDQPCPCGRNSKVISELVGRSQDFLSGTKDRRLQATQLAGYLKDLTCIGQLQFIQDKELKISVQYTGIGEAAQKELELIFIHLHSRLGAEVKIKASHVDSILKTNRGKQPLVLRQTRI